MSGVRACLQPTEGPACVSGIYGDVRGSSPSWRSNFCDNGRHHLSGPLAELGSQGLAAWDKAPAVPEPALRRHIEQPCSSSYAEPTVVGGHTSYYGRRTMGEGIDSNVYRRTLKLIPEPVRPERPEGKRSIPEPYGPMPPAPRGLRPPPDDVRYRPAGALPEPPLPRLGRPDGITGLRESDKEVVFDATLGRKIRVGQESYRGTGRAGDRSLVYGASGRVEDDPTYYRSMKDAPTFVRFCNSLPPKPAVSPHQRREEGVRRQAEQERRREAELVSTLTIDGVADDD
ncbi:hypothetical protein PLESTB_000912700 [Pleodorina starrii]|uniref:Uncharacterized protein n=1 Tax=Pleodorina starrii TaxID=330485 RepID=A0A9W6F398_9CHLO|nr:hypothetical protein PLESTM_001523800 [Pleodorina starrii]GLC54852.1 hypothetical protein PLESTB_000912700 [Pleodorina starrii]GLC73699.1 hypothetical protein PLESTF_001409800 [Pleodorina starrii]